MAAQIMNIIDNNKENFREIDYINICNLLKDLKREEDNKENVYNIRYLKQSINGECMTKGIKILNKIKHKKVIINTETLEELKRFKNIEDYSFTFKLNETNNLKILEKSSINSYYSLDNDDDDDDEVFMEYKKYILLSYNKI